LTPRTLQLVAHVSDHEGRVRVAVIGGYSRSLTLFRGPLLAAMAARGHQVTAMAADAEPAVTAELAAMGIAFEEIPLARTSLNPGRDGATLLHLTRRLRALQPDVVFAYTMKPVIYGGLAARLAGIKRRFAMITGLGYAFMGQETWQRRALSALVTRMVRLGLDGADAVFLQNPDDQRDLAARGVLGAVRRQALVRGSGVDLAHYAPAPLPAGPLRFLFAGRLLREKGFLDYVEMARRVRAHHPDIVFTVVGRLDPNPTSFRLSDLEAWQREGIIDVRGEVADVRPLLAASHVLVLPSYREGTPRSALEAMSMGRAVIVTDVPGCREVVVDGETGFLVPLQAPAGLAAAAERLIASPALLSQMGEAGRARALEHYDARKVAAGMLQVMGL
jgi:glycosyltransferase involved in cell wall biosynthesis